MRACAATWRDLHVLDGDRVWRRCGPTAESGFRGPHARLTENVRLLADRLRDWCLCPDGMPVRGVLLQGHPASEIWVAREARDVPILRPERAAAFIEGRAAGAPPTPAQIAAVVDQLRHYAAR